MPDLKFAVESVQPIRSAATPMLSFRVCVGDLAAGPLLIHSAMLRTQIRIEPARRKYTGAEQERLHSLFDTPDRWGKTVRDMLWTHVSTLIPPFLGETTVELHVPCSFDFALAATSYFDALEGGEIPLCFLFSGTVFYQESEGGRLQVSQIPWDREAKFRLAASDWKTLVEQYYPNSAWLALHKDVFDRLHAFKRELGLATWDQTIEQLLLNVDEGVTP